MAGEDLPHACDPPSDRLLHFRIRSAVLLGGMHEVAAVRAVVSRHAGEIALEHRLERVGPGLQFE